MFLFEKRRGCSSDYVPLKNRFELLLDKGRDPYGDKRIITKHPLYTPRGVQGNYSGGFNVYNSPLFESRSEMCFFPGQSVKRGHEPREAPEGGGEIGPKRRKF